MFGYDTVCTGVIPGNEGIVACGRATGNLPFADNPFCPKANNALISEDIKVPCFCFVNASLALRLSKCIDAQMCSE